jgi:hypothetical protein
MSNTTKGRTVIGIIRSVDRKSTSRMGNPTYKITMEDGIEYVTQTNGAVGYGATNYRPRLEHRRRREHHRKRNRRDCPR